MTGGDLNWFALRRLGGVLGGPHRQPDDKARPGTGLAFDLDLPAVALDDAERDGQPQPGAMLAFGRKERVEDPRAYLRRHTGAGVDHLDDHVLGAVAVIP